MKLQSATLGTIVKAVGRKGEVKLLPGPDFWPEALNVVELELISQNEIRRAVHLNRYRAKGETFILTLSGIENMHDAESLVGSELRVSLENLNESTRPQRLLPFQIIGLEVRLRDGSLIGEVVDLLLGKAQNCLIVASGEERLLVPNVPDVVYGVHLEEGFVEIDPPEGLLDLRW